MWQMISTIFVIIITVINALFLLVIRVNDLKHLEISVKELKDTVNETNNKVGLLSERISCMEGMIKVKTKRTK